MRLVVRETGVRIEDRSKYMIKYEKMSDVKDFTVFTERVKFIIKENKLNAQIPQGADESLRYFITCSPYIASRIVAVRLLHSNSYHTSDLVSEMYTMCYNHGVIELKFPILELTLCGGTLFHIEVEFNEPSCEILCETLCETVKLYVSYKLYKTPIKNDPKKLYVIPTCYFSRTNVPTSKTFRQFDFSRDIPVKFDMYDAVIIQSSKPLTEIKETRTLPTDIEYYQKITPLLTNIALPKNVGDKPNVYVIPIERPRSEMCKYVLTLCHNVDGADCDLNFYINGSNEWFSRDGIFEKRFLL